MIHLQSIVKQYNTKNGAFTAVDHVDVHVKKGEIHGVIGYSGAGKSTLIRCVNLLEQPTSGSVMINGVDLTTASKAQLQQSRQKIGMIFQHFNLLKTATVHDNIAIPLKLLGYSKDVVEQRVHKYAEIVGLSDKLSHYPNQLSGGQKQRVAIARALSQEPEVLLSDEATSALDPETTESILDLLLEINEQFGITILLITHEMNVIQRICDYVYVLEQGKLVEHNNAIELFKSPKHPTTRKFLSTISQRNLSSSLIEQLNLNGAVMRLTFVGDSTGKPLIADVATQFTVQPNILAANIIELKNGIVGNIVVHIPSDDKQIAAIEHYLVQQGVQVELLGGADA